MKYIIILSCALVIIGACTSAIGKPATNVGELELLGRCAGNLDTYVDVMLPQKSSLPRRERQKIGWAKRSLTMVLGGKNLIEDNIVKKNPKVILPVAFETGFKIGHTNMIKIMAAENSFQYEVEMYYLITACLDISNKHAMDTMEID